MTLDSSGPAVPGPSAPQPHLYTFSPALVALESPAKSRAAVAVHEMAGHLVRQQVERGRRGLVVCGPSAGIGTSLLSANLAIAIAQIGVTVLLVDGDLHHPSLDALIAPAESTIGLQQVLREPTLSAVDAMHREILPRLSVLYAGGACADASELIGSPSTDDVLTEAMRNFDYTIVDAPPANRSNDARRLASTIGYALIAARRDRTYVDDVSTFNGDLAQDRAQVIATVFVDA